ncbi:pimeloyl-ACP methyl ester carboxylesterase [Pontibacter aydingkolensis]|uniref:Alpha/beta hydrolase n=1 Tax=Pontibacter aydingkolensis TaxID=1911536 RepID=A0ABS7CXZ4_9BACT|nr:alpha/beta hydrolase [Pontibacter aydingkolensis]MBW7468709.1 alpha/beta hydrolase [Pontibacter aydingkolensis]
MSNKRTVEQVIEQHKAAGKFIQVDGLRTFVLDEGEGEVVFCIHGVPTSSYLYRKVIHALAAKGMRGVSIDLPGLGLSDRPENFEYTFHNFAHFCARAAEVMGIEKYHLLIHDIGGPIGFAMAAENKEKVLSLTILNTWIEVDKFQKPLPMRPFEKPLLGEAELMTVQHPTWYLLFSQLGVNHADDLPKEEVYAYVDLLKRDDGGKAFLKIMRNFQKSEEFKQLCYQAVQHVNYPVQAIWGADDPALDYEHYGNEIKRVANLSTVHKLDSKHFLQEEKPKEIAQLVVQLADSAKV